MPTGQDFSEDILLVNERKVFLSDDNLFSTLLRFKPNYAVNEVRTWKFQYEKEWRREFKNNAHDIRQPLFFKPVCQFCKSG